jgi:diguanylate cyclase (GGDEF)-like protein
MTAPDDGPTDQQVGGLPNAAFHAAFDRSTGAMAVTALDGRVLEANDAFVTRMAEAGLRPPPDDGLPVERVPVPVPVAVTEVSDEPDLPSRVLLDSVLGAEVQLLRRPDGSPGWWLLTLDPPRRQDGLRDPLTGLADRRLLLERVGLAVARRVHRSVELVVLDLDDFKGINDEYGHVVGDRVLVEVAARLATCVRPADLVARWGGDEFVVLLEEGAELGGEIVCRRVEEALVRPLVIDGLELNLSVSCGWVGAEPGDDAVGLLQRADLKMYGVKRMRRQDRSLSSNEELRARLERARRRAVELAGVSTHAQERARLVLEKLQSRRDGSEPG